MKDNGLSDIGKHHYAIWITRLYDKIEFDECREAGSLLMLANLFEDIRKLWVAGEPIEDEELSNMVCTFFREYGKRYVSPLSLEVERALATLSEFCFQKNQAIIRRLDGDVSQATFHERIAEKHYNELPTAWKW